MEAGRIARGAGMAALIVVAGLAGGLAGRHFRGSADLPGAPDAIPPSSLVAGSAFPDVPVASPEGDAARTAALLADGGGAVLFLRLDCVPCGETVAAWQSAIDAGELTGVRVLGITFDPPAEIEAYRREKGLTFPVYQDAERTFLTAHGVRAVPLIVLVDGSGTIVPGGAEMRTAVDGEILRRRIGRG